MNVLSVTIAKPIKGYHSAAEAIRGAKNNARQVRAKTDGAILAGRRLVGGNGSPARWALQFTGSKWLAIWCEDDEVKWTVVDQLPEFSAVESYALAWPSGARSVVQPHRWVADRADADFSQLFLSDGEFYVYFRKKLILCFYCVRDVNSGNCVLSVREGT